jgi:hypothetical protein
MCLRKNRPKRCPTHILSKLIKKFYRGKIVQKLYLCISALKNYQTSGHPVLAGWPDALEEKKVQNVAQLIKN